MPAQGLGTQSGQRVPALVSVDGQSYPLRSAQVRARAEGGLACTTLVQEFSNPYEEALEVIYTMPLPADGAVLGYTIHLGERVIRGEIEPREKAEALYKDALYAGKAAGLLEQDRLDTFQQRLGNIPAHQDARIEIEVLHPLSYVPAIGSSLPLWEYRFPTVVGERYHGDPERTPDASRLMSDRAEENGTPARIALSLEVCDFVDGTGSVTSTSHDILGELIDGGIRVSLRNSARLDRDFVLRWAAPAGMVGVRVVEGTGLESDQGRYALVTVTPPGSSHASLARDLTVLIDASGSMTGEPIRIAKEVVEDLLRSLEPGDRFEVWQFATQTVPLSRGFEKATQDSVRRCVEAVRGIQAGGGTEMGKALETALEVLRPDSQRQIVVVTDGQIAFEGTLFKTMRQQLPAYVRVHVVGIGSSPNRTLTFGLARAGRGVELFAGDSESAANVARQLRCATVHPQLTDVRVAGSAVVGCSPEHPRDIFAGQPLVLAAELNRSGGNLEISGTLAGSNEVWVWRMEIPEAGMSAEGIRATTIPIGALYGRERVADLEIGFAEGSAGGFGPRPDLDKEIEAIAWKHRITSRRTSLIAIAEEPSVDPNAPRRRTKLALEVPFRVSVEGLGLGKTVTRSIGFGEVEPMAAPLMASTSQVLYHLTQKPDVSEWTDAATAISMDGAALVLELESPYDDFHLPKGSIVVRVNGREMKARVQERKSSPRGPHSAGVMVKLCLVLLGATWPSAGRIELTWRRGRGPFGGKWIGFRATLDPSGKPAEPCP